MYYEQINELIKNQIELEIKYVIGNEISIKKNDLINITKLKCLIVQ